MRLIRLFSFKAACLLVFFLSVDLVSADSLTLPQIFGDHMVLQCDQSVIIWGWAEPGEKVTVSIAGQVESAMTSSQGRWRLQLAPMSASKVPSKLTVQAGEEIVDFKDVLIGEVWLCSGQSNMQWELEETDDAEADIAASAFPLIRHVQIGRGVEANPLDDVKLQHPWERCTPEAAAHFTAVGYYFARHLQDVLDVPIGLVNSSWGGSNIESFTSLDGFKAVPQLNDIVQQVESSFPDHPIYKQKVRDALNEMKAWLKQAELALAQNQRVFHPPTWPEAVPGFTDSQFPTLKYNAMIHGLAPYGIRGILWYQCESNHREDIRYVQKTRAQLASWRGLWGRPDLPYYYVQIAPYLYDEEDAYILPRFWEAQAAIEQEIPNTHMVVINDVGNINDIHPRDKKTVGSRLAAQALVHTYGQDGIAQGPTFEAMHIEQDHMILSFTHTGSGLTTRDGMDPSHFEIAGENGVFVPAQARILQDTIILQAEGISKPVAMRFAWNKLAEPNLQNKEGFPTSAFRAGSVPERLKR